MNARLDHAIHYCQNKPKPSHSVYVLQCRKLIKIGHASNPINRINSLKTGNPFPVSTIAIIPTNNPTQLEHELHNKFARFRLKGEWFKLPQPQLDWLLSFAHCIKHNLCTTLDHNMQIPTTLPVPIISSSHAIQWPINDPVCLPCFADQ